MAEALKGEAGNTMIQTLVGSIVSLVSIGAIAAGIAGITQFQVKQQLRADITNQATLTDSTFRTDVLWAAAVTPVDEHRVEFTVPGPASGCKLSVWNIEPAGERTQVRVTTTSYPQLDTATGAPECAGEPSEPASVVLIDDADPGSAFEYSNASGRPLTFSDGSLEPRNEGGEAPSGTAREAWESKDPATAALQTSVKASAKMVAPFRSAQRAENLMTPAPKADAPVHFVPDGDLR